MGSLHYGHRTLLKVSCNDFSLSFTGESENKKSVDLNINKNTPAELIVDSIYEDKIIVETITTDGTLVKNSGQAVESTEKFLFFSRLLFIYIK